MKLGKIDRQTPVPIHFQIRKKLESQIKRGKLPVGSMLPPERELMKMLDVSRATIRKAMDDLTEMGLTRRVTGKGTFVISQKHTDDLFFVLFLPSIEMLSSANYPFHFIWHSIIKGTSEACKDYSIRLQILYVPNDETGCKQGIVELSRLKNVNGVIFAGSIGYESLYDYVIASRIPRVLVTQEAAPPETTCVRADSYDGARVLLNYLLDLGHTRIGMVYHPESKLVRCNAYKDMIEERGIKYDQELLEAAEFDDTDNVGNQLMSLPEPPTAIFASNDILAVRLIKNLQQQNISVPGDVSVVGFDDMPGVKELSPPLTTVQIDSEKIGYKAIEVLKRWNESPDYEPSLELLETKLMIRESCASKK